MAVTVGDRLWSRVRKTRSCWLWEGGRDIRGYGYLRDEQRRQVLAHRVAWEATFGPIPPGCHIFHVCKNRHCVGLHYLRLKKLGGTLADRFWRKVRKGRVGNTGCWMWIGATCSSGYGSLRIKTRTVSAHRTCWELIYGPIPDGLCVLHRCDVPSCVNPTHLFLGTHQDNSDDKIKKGRGRWPGGGGNRKLTAETVRSIRRLAASGLRHRDIAKRFGITFSNVSYIVARKTWKHVKDGVPSQS